MAVINIVDEKNVKVRRVLTIYSKLIQGAVVNKRDMADLFKVNEKTIQRDLKDIRDYFSYESQDGLGSRDVLYRHDKNGYNLDNTYELLDRDDILAITKILLESRAFCKEELKHLTNSILGQVDNEQRKNIKDVIGNELFNYVPLKHNDLLLSKIWNLSELIRNKEITQITYIKVDGAPVQRIVKPVALIFSEYYFYLIAYYNDFDSPTVFRMDRIQEYKAIGEKFPVPNAERFEDGEFRKRVQFMYAGKLMKIKFEFTGSSIEAVLDRLPTAKIIKKIDNKFIVEAEVYGKGIKMWILSQGKNIKVIAPDDFCKEILSEIEEMKRLYE